LRPLRPWREGLSRLGFLIPGRFFPHFVLTMILRFFDFSILQPIPLETFLIPSAPFFASKN
jgi:hypothetical protein